NFSCRRCPFCGGRGGRWGVASRTVHDLGDSLSGRPIELHICYSTHRCLACRRSFPADQSDLAPLKSQYTHRVQQTAVRLVIEDDMPYRMASWHLWRDHRVFVPWATIQNWVEAAGEKTVHPAEARAGVEKNGHADSNWSCVIRNSAPTQEVSMSTSLLYHAFGIRGYRYTRTDYQGGQVIFTIHQEPENCRCSACGSTQVVSRGQVERRFRALPIGSRATFVVLPIPRVECRTCGAVRQVEVSFADPRRSYTSSFERYALELGRRMTIRDVAVHLGVGWDMIKDIQKRDLSRRFAKPKLKHLRHIAIDEIAIAKGHRYLTIVMDLETGAVVFVGDGKGADALKPFWKRLRPSGAKIAAVAMDMSAAYRRAVATYLPKAKIVFDRFHVVKLFND